MPISPLRAILFVVVGALTVMVQLGALRIAFDKLGLSPGSAGLLLMSSLIGSLVNLPLFSVPADPLQLDSLPAHLRELIRSGKLAFTGRTLIAVNVGGCVIPMAFSAYLVGHNAIPLGEAVLAVAAVSFVAHRISFLVPGLGIGMPILIAPLAAAAVALLVDAAQAPTLAYVGGSVGVLIGADLLRLPQMRQLGAPLAAIGGAGSFDGIFVTGLVAVLLA